MATNYTLTDIDGTPIRVFSRKDGAVKAAERDSLLAYEIITDSGKVVTRVDNRPTTEAPAPEDNTEEENTVTEQATEQDTSTTEKAEKAPAAPKGTAVPITAGSKAQAAGFGALGVALAESQGLTATVALGEKTVYVSGNKTEVKKFQKAADALWASAAEGLKAFKKENKDARKEQFKTSDGQRQMLKDENAFVAGFTDSGLI